MEPSQDFTTLQESVQKSLVSTVKTTNRIAAEDLTFQRTVNPTVAQCLDDQSARLRDLTTRLLKSAADVCGLTAPTLEDAEDIDMNWRGVVDVVDTVLEKADTALDEYTGLIKRKDPPGAENGADAKKQKATPKVVRNANIMKPQTTFELQPENSPDGPWKPIITKKHHAVLPLKKSLVTFTTPSGSTQYKHPYEAEITQNDYPNRVFEKAEPIKFRPMEESDVTYIDTYEGVLEMLEHLKEAEEIAVDLEHHDFRTYTGLVCLMQISTRERDFIIDTLQPWRHKLEVLNEVFTDPGVVKVFHGAHMDMIWLQRDLGLYVNGLFDTYFACKLLQYPGRGLAFLLSKFAGFTADKQYQLADWRMRPIPSEMMYYARSDTHYLLYIYDEVRNQLIDASDRSNPETDLIQQAVDASKEVSLYRHEHLDFDEKTGEGTRGWYNYVLKNGHLALNADQFAVFRALWKWRDTAARREDENPNYIMSTTTLTQIARTCPPDQKALHSLLPPSPPIAKRNLSEIWQTVKKVKAEGGPSLLQFLTSLEPESLSKHGVPRVAKSSSNLPVVDGEVAIRSLPKSQLFGTMPISSRWEETRKDERADETVPFPWQKFVQGAANGEASATPAIDTHAGDTASRDDDEPAPELPLEQEEDDEFTLKRGKRRKVETEDSDSTSDEESSGEAEQESEGEKEPGDGVLEVDVKPIPKKKKKKDKYQVAEDHEERQAAIEEKRRKKAERQQRQKEKIQRKRDDEKKSFSAVPFDYSQAASVINADRDAAKEAEAAKGKKQKKQKVFDPYVKSVEEGVKGARKAPPIKGERSATFRK
ncbi:exonuclease [Emericellopsis atlantica]|uniref:Exonuclease n=1 Tax=Emericellopsis atlantica TaxID=2614577 RepID=A0A9P8CL00_9HYPO|nr:exonuclease [Emericellopsis atlantica]KAG9251114.1 exonuclease [Emericellopsis atlantica]